MYNSSMRSSSSSRYKQQTSQFRDSRQVLSSQVTQQKQIEQLEQKVDIILFHNSQLKEQNQSLKKLLEKRSISTHSVNQQISITNTKLIRQLELRDLETDQLKSALHLQIQTITRQLVNSKTENSNLSALNKQYLQTIEQYQENKGKEIENIIKQIKDQMYENALAQENQFKQQLSEKQRQYHIKTRQLKEENEKSIIKNNQQYQRKIITLQQKNQKENNQVRKTIEVDFERRMKEIEKNANERCRQTRQKSEKYIKSILQNNRDDNQQIQDVLKKQIDTLKNSLKSRQVIIEELLDNYKSKGASDSERYYLETQELRKRIKEITEHFFKQSELLKIKMAIKHQADVNQVAKAYETRLDILGQRLNYLEIQNERLRQNYEQEVRGKMNLRHKFEIEASKMKNIIRKMKIQLESYGKQIRLNIDGIRDRANSFSMSMIGQLGQQKTKKTFYEEEIRKLQQIITLKQSEIDTTISQCNDKVKFYHQKLESSKQKILELEENLSQQFEQLTKDIQYQKQSGLNQLQRQREHYEEQYSKLENNIETMNEKYEELEVKAAGLKSDKSMLEKQLKDKDHDMQSLKAHLETLKLEMEMMGSDAKTGDVVAPLKKYYERIIEDIKADKESLQNTNSYQADQIGRLVAKYKTLELSMQRTVSSMQKRRQLDQKVMNMGMDNNLVKNLAEIFKKNDE